VRCSGCTLSQSLRDFIFAGAVNRNTTGTRIQLAVLKGSVKEKRQQGQHTPENDSSNSGGVSDWWYPTGIRRKRGRQKDEEDEDRRKER